MTVWLPGLLAFAVLVAGILGFAVGLSVRREIDDWRDPRLAFAPADPADFTAEHPGSAWDGGNWADLWPASQDPSVND